MGERKTITREKITWESFISQEEKEATTKETDCERDMERKGYRSVCRLGPISVLAHSFKRCDDKSHKKVSEDEDGYFETCFLNLYLFKLYLLYFLLQSV